ncbi:uncharacterized protein METZ01_LOCUS149393 [marine metagenome]|uniref:Uncharacterized protein n=1 Tax=marine metagenome TaxID=408172 RepID=A0A382A596_9ZZZZ
MPNFHTYTAHQVNNQSRLLLLLILDQYIAGIWIL